MSSIYLKLGALGVILCGLLGLYLWGQHVGAGGVQAKWDAAKVTQAQAVAEYQSKLEAAQKAAMAVTEAGQAKVDASNEANHETVRTITKIVHDTPSPPQCILQPSSVSVITNAIRDANATTPH